MDDGLPEYNPNIRQCGQCKWGQLQQHVDREFPGNGFWERLWNEMRGVSHPVIWYNVLCRRFPQREYMAVTDVCGEYIDNGTGIGIKLAPEVASRG